MKIILMATLVLISCSSPERIIQNTIDRVIRVDTLRVVKKETKYDTVWIKDGNGESVRYIVKTDTLWKRIMIKSKPDTIYVPITDTIIVSKTEIVKEESDNFLKGVTLMGILYTLLGIGAFAVIYPIWERIWKR